MSRAPTLTPAHIRMLRSTAVRDPARRIEDHAVVPRVLCNAVGLSPLVVPVAVFGVEALPAASLCCSHPARRVVGTLPDVFVRERDLAEQQVPALLFTREADWRARSAAALRLSRAVDPRRQGDQSGVASPETHWTANADQIATLLSNANQVSWKLGAMKAMMHDHLRLTTAEVVARLQHNWAADVRAYDRIHLQILHMSEMLSNGIVTQFPSRFR